MRKLVVGLIVCASSVIGLSMPADAAPKPCKTKAACRVYAYNTCVADLKARGFTTAAAQSRCSSALT